MSDSGTISEVSDDPEFNAKICQVNALRQKQKKKEKKQLKLEQVLCQQKSIQKGKPRYYAIVYPLSAMKVHSKSRTCKILAATWIVPLICASPYLFYKSYPFVIFSEMGSISRQICTDRFDEIDIWLYGEEARQTGGFRKGFFFFLFVVIYLVPLLVILGTCVRIAMRLLKPIVEKQESVQGQRITRKREENKRRVARMIIVVAVAFIAAWSPFYLVTFISQVQTMSFLRRSNYIFVMLAVHLVGFINSCINPFIYNFMSDKFRKSFAQIVLSMCCLCARVPVCQKCCAKRSAHAFRSRNNSEFDQDYSGAQFENKTQLMTHSTTHSEAGSRMDSARCQYKDGARITGGGPTIIRLTTLNRDNRATPSAASSTPEVPNGVTSAGQVSSSLLLGGAGVSGCEVDGGREELGSVGCDADDIIVTAEMVGAPVSGSRSHQHLHHRQHLHHQHHPQQDDLGLEADQYDQPTYKLITNTQD